MQVWVCEKDVIISKTYESYYYYDERLLPIIARKRQFDKISFGPGLHWNALYMYM